MKIHASHCMMAASVKMTTSLGRACHTGEISIRLNNSKSSPNLELSSTRGCRSILVTHLLLPRCIGKWIQVEVIMVGAGLMTDFGDQSACRVNVGVDGDLRCVPLLLLPYFQGLIKT